MRSIDEKYMTKLITASLYFHQAAIYSNLPWRCPKGC